MILDFAIERIWKGDRRFSRLVCTRKYCRKAVCYELEATAFGQRLIILVKSFNQRRPSAQE